MSVIEKHCEAKLLPSSKVVFSPLIRNYKKNTETRCDRPRIALISMPFYSARWGSIQLGLLKSVLRQNGYSAVDIYFNLAFARLIGWVQYDHLSLATSTQVGEWLFAHDVYKTKDVTKDKEYLTYYDKALRPALTSFSNHQDDLINLKYNVIPGFMDDCVAMVDWSEFDAVGFSCTFQQVVPSIALAQRIKEAHKNIMIIFGGSGVEGEMGTALKEAHSIIDHVVSGEGENKILKIMQSLETAESEDVSQTLNSPTKAIILDDLPTPDYDTFYEICADYNYDGEPYMSELSVPLELSRGCWWGQKKHCTFCGLNGTTMKFRSKSAERALLEIDTLSRKYNRYRFQVVDNILDYNYFRNVLPKLRDNSCHYEFFFEVKSNLKPADLFLLKQAGCHHIQPGIESLNTHVLELMQKGVTGIGNIALLKWSKYYDIIVSWNLLFGFPHEVEDDYQSQLALIGKITHFQPPNGMGRIRMDRFSPIFSNKENWGFNNVRYARCYDFIYPDHVNKWGIAYFYDSMAETQVSADTYSKINDSVEMWKKKWLNERKPALFFRNGLYCLHVVDKRSDTPRSYKLVDAYRLVFLLTMDSPLGLDCIARICQKHGFNIEETQVVLCDLISAEIIVYLDNKYFNLALPWAKNWVHKSVADHEIV